MSENWKIRQATAADLPQLLALDQKSDNAAHWSPDSYRAIFSTDSPKRLALIAQKNDVVYAFVIALTATCEWEIENIVTEHEHRRRGLATKLIAEILRRARASSAEKIFLEVRKSNSIARSFYEKMGFTPTGLRPAYYHAPDEDAVLYNLLLQ
jgi:ribosomal-protein-alanine N-acetyltransferase